MNEPINELKTRSKGPWLKWGILTVTGFLHILHSKPLRKIKKKRKSFSLTSRDSSGVCGFWKRGQLGTANLPTGDCGKGNFVFDFKHFWDALQTFYTFLRGTFCGCLGRVSEGTTVNKSDMLGKYQ